MGGKQRENLAKYCYDVSKILVAVLVIGPLAKWGESSPAQMAPGVILGLIAAASFLGIGLILDRKEAP